MRADEVHARGAEDVVLHERVLFEVHGGDGGVVRRLPRGAGVHDRDRGALRRRDRARRPAHPELRVPGRPVGEGVPAQPRHGRHARALRGPDPRARARAHGDGARGHRQDGLQRLLPDRLGLRQLGQEQRRRRRPGPWLGGRLDHRLHAADHGRGPAGLRPAVRALPERRARVDAGYRHRLLGSRPRARDGVREGEVRVRPRGPDHHLRPDVPARGHQGRGARARPRLRRRRQALQAHPGPDHGPLALLQGVPGAGRGPGGRGRPGPGGRAGHRGRAGPGGHRPQRVHPRGGGRDLRPQPHGHRPAAAGRRADHRRGRQQGLPDGHAVQHEADRGDRPAEDGFPRPAQPGRDRGRAGHHRALQRQPPGHHGDPPGRRCDLRDDGPRRFGRRVPVRVRRHARVAAQGQPDRVRGSRRARGALPPGRHGPDPRVLARQAQPGVDRLHRRPAGADHRVHQGRDPLPGAGDADRQVPGELHRPAGGRSPEGDRQEEPRRDGEAAADVHRGLPGERRLQRRHRVAVGDQREVRRLLVQQVPRRLLRAHLLPHGLAEGELPGRVHGRADLLGHGHEGQGPVLRQPGGADGDRASCRRT